MTGNAQTEGTQQATKQRMVDLIKSYSGLWPLVLGIAFGRTGRIVGSYNSYQQTDAGVFTDGGVLITLALIGIVCIVVTTKNIRLPRRQLNAVMRCCIAVEAALLIALGIVEQLGIPDDTLKLVLCTGITFIGLLTLYYWLRRARGSTTAVAAILTFSALLVSEITIYLCWLMPDGVADFVAAAFVLTQYCCMITSRRKSKELVAPEGTVGRDYFGFAQSMISSTQFLTVTAVGIGLLSLLIGLLRGYPDGESISFDPQTRTAYMIVAIVLAAAIIVLVMRGKNQVMTIGIWVIMQALACLALLAYAAFPDNLTVGAMFTTILNAMMVGFTWYIMIAFMSYGWRSPFYYAACGWFVYLGFRAVARMVLLGFYPLTSNDTLMAVLMGSLLMISTQAVFVQFIYIAKREGEADLEKSSARQSALAKLMGLEANESLSDMRHATMQHNAEEMGKQFLLSDREVEVLALYALGFTQKRVAEELYISQGTAHAHIKRIYAKTGLHSRQEILDYMKQYTS